MRACVCEREGVLFGFVSSRCVCGLVVRFGGDNIYIYIRTAHRGLSTATPLAGDSVSALLSHAARAAALARLREPFVHAIDVAGHHGNRQMSVTDLLGCSHRDLHPAVRRKAALARSSVSASCPHARPRARAPP